MTVIVFLSASLSRRVQAVSLQSQVRAALGQTVQELSERLAGVSMRMMELREMIGRSLELLRVLIKVCFRLRIVRRNQTYVLCSYLFVIFRASKPLLRMVLQEMLQHLSSKTEA